MDYHVKTPPITMAEVTFEVSLDTLKQLIDWSGDKKILCLEITAVGGSGTCTFPRQMERFESA